MKPGDVVRLKSGGPKMTVESIRDSDDTRVIYWDDPNGLTAHSVKTLCLEPDPSIEEDTWRIRAIQLSSELDAISKIMKACDVAIETASDSQVEMIKAYCRIHDFLSLKTTL